MTRRKSETLGQDRRDAQFADEGQEIIRQLDLPPATPDAELLSMCNAVRKRGHIHDIEELLREKSRVLKSREFQR